MKTNTPPKTWFITGTSSGFGRTLTEKLLARGDRVAATLRKVNALDDLKVQYGDDLWVASLDVTNAEAVRQIVDRAFVIMGRIDVVVNNAAYGLFGAAEEVSDDQIRHQIDTNLIGSIQVIRAALPHLRAQGGGRILQVSSEGGQIAYPNFSLYHTTKWGDRRLRRGSGPGSRAVQRSVHDRRARPRQNQLWWWPGKSAADGRLRKYAGRRDAPCLCGGYVHCKGRSDQDGAGDDRFRGPQSCAQAARVGQQHLYLDPCGIGRAARRPRLPERHRSLNRHRRLTITI
jgi:short chain dehydrogenase